MKRTYTIADLKATNDSMKNYTVELKVYGCTKTTMKIHTGIVGNHFEIITNLVNKEYSGCAEVLGAKVTGKKWAQVSPF